MPWHEAFFKAAQTFVDYKADKLRPTGVQHGPHPSCKMGVSTVDDTPLPSGWLGGWGICQWEKSGTSPGSEEDGFRKPPKYQYCHARFISDCGRESQSFCFRSSFATKKWVCAHLSSPCADLGFSRIQGQWDKLDLGGLSCSMLPNS